ncbi:MAG: asparagine synthase-related protein, partial [Thermoplasmata archaeon]
MTAIAGMFGSQDKQLVKRMIASLQHRGKGQVEYFQDDNIGLAAIGEHAVRTTGNLCAAIDTENRLVHAFQNLSERDLSINEFELNGGYAIALWDGKKMKLRRDKFGIKPLFYTEIEGMVLFASEIKALLKVGFDRTTNVGAFCQRNILHHIIGNATSLNEIKQVPPGCSVDIMLTKDNRIPCLRILPDVSRPIPIRINNSEESEILHLIKTMSNCFTKYASANRKQALLLSGGLDSSILAAIMAELSDHKIVTFTFADTDNAEDIHYARVVAENIGTEHHEIILDPTVAPRILPQIVATTEGMFGGFSFLMFSREIRRLLPECATVLSAEGADELFGGYGYLRDIERHRRELLLQTRKLGDCAEAASIMEHIRLMFSSGIETLMQHDLGDQLSNSHMLFADHCGMAVGLEILPPYLYEEVANLALGLSTHLKVNNGITKYL